jgi:holin-like protein
VRILVGIAWLWLFLAAGDLVVHALGLPIPGSVVGMLLLWAALETGLVRLSWLERGAQSVLGVLGLLFVPAGVGFLQFAGAGRVWLAVVVTIGVGALVTLGVTGRIAERAVRHG